MAALDLLLVPGRHVIRATFRMVVDVKDCDDLTLAEWIEEGMATAEIVDWEIE